MTVLYNCRHAGDQYRVTKFDHAMNIEASYLCTQHECQCPRGPHPTCRHRKMLPMFIARGHIGDEWFLDFDRGGWVQLGLEWSEPRQIKVDISDIPHPMTDALLEREPELSPTPDASPATVERDPALSSQVEPSVTPVSAVAGRPKGVFIRRRL